MNVQCDDNLSDSEAESSDEVLHEREPGFGVRAPGNRFEGDSVDEMNSEIHEIRPRGFHQKLIHAIPPAIMLSVKALENQDWTSLRADWKTWSFTLQVASSSQNFSEKAKYSLLIMRGGPLIQEIAMDGQPDKDEVRVGEADEPVFSNLLKRIEARIAQAANANHDVSRLSEATQKDKESIEAFAKRLRDLAKLCNMDKASTEMMIRNRLFDGALFGARLAELTLPNPSMSAQEIVDMGTRMEERERAKVAKKLQVESVHAKNEPGEEVTISAVGRSRGSVSRPQSGSNQRDRNAMGFQSWKQHDERPSRYDSSYRDSRFRSSSGATYANNQRFSPYDLQRSSFQTKNACKNCGLDCSQRSQCSAKDANCYNCGKGGHLARVCRSQRSNINSRLMRSNQRGDKEMPRINELSNKEASKVEEKSDDE